MSESTAKISSPGVRITPNFAGGFADSHCHLADQRIATKVEDFIARAKAKNIHFFLQGGVGPEDWQRQKELNAKHPEIGLCFGLHPYWASEKTMQECDQGLDLLSREIHHSLAIGELGLDLRPHIVKENFDQQMHCFVAQLELAEMASKPVVLHLVRAFGETKSVFSHYKMPARGGLVHSFNSGVKEADYFLSLGLHLSIGGPLCRPNNERLRQAVRILPLNQLLIESDSPDQAPPSYGGEQNEPISIIEVAEIIAEIKKVTSQQVLDISTQNLEKLLHGK